MCKVPSLKENNFNINDVHLAVTFAFLIQNTYNLVKFQPV